MSVAVYKTIIRRWVETAWNRGDFSAVATLYAADYVLHAPITDIHGPDALVGFIATYRTAMPDLHITIQDMIAAGDKVAWRILTRGTHTGEFMGVPPSGRASAMTAIIISRFAAGRWVEDWLNNDDLGMLQQIGVIPPSPSA